MGRGNPLEMKAHADLVRERQEKRMSGSSDYIGDYFDIAIGSQEYKNYKIRSLLIISIIAVIHLAAGFVNNPGMVTFFVAIPYMAAFLSLLYFLVIRFQLPKEKNKFRFGEVSLLFSRLRLASVYLGLSLLAGILGESAFVTSPPAGDRLSRDYLFLAIEVLAAAITILLILKQSQILKKVRSG